MEPTFVTIRYSRVFPYPLEATYAWLTDFQDDDASLTTEVIHRRVVKKREGDTITLEGEVGLFGSSGSGVAEVRLAPPDRWTATIAHGPGKGSVYEYRLARVPGGTRLEVDYRVRVRRWSSRIRVWLFRPLARRPIARMWDGFAASMARDLGAPGAAAPRAPRA